MCKFVYIVRTDQNPFGSCQPFSILYIMMTACATAYWATCGQLLGRIHISDSCITDEFSHSGPKMSGNFVREQQRIVYIYNIHIIYILL